MNFQSMDYFVMVARELSFTKAAEALHITQQTLSAHIAAMEQELECKLLVRHVPLELTYAGEVFLRYAVDFQRKYYEMQREFGDIVHHEKGKLRIGVAYTRGRTIMPDVIERFQLQYPMIEIQVMERANDVLRKMLLNGEMDLIIANLPDKIPGIELLDFYEEEIVLFVSKKLLSTVYGENMQSTIEQVEENGDFSLFRDCPFLLNNQKDIAGRIGRHLMKRANFHPMIKAQSENMETLLDLCVKGIGACFCPENLAAKVLNEQQLSQLYSFRFDDTARYSIRFGWLEETHQWSVISNFVNKALDFGV